MPLGSIDQVPLSHRPEYYKTGNGKASVIKWRNKNYKSWYAKNRERVLEVNKAWRLANPEKVKKIKQAYKAKRYQLEGRLSKELIDSVYKKCTDEQGNLICILCLKIMSLLESSIEHITPLTRGGTNTEENLWLAHRTCNSSKNDKLLWEYRLNAIR